MIPGMVSCIVPTYKRNETLHRAIKSILVQTYANLEVLVVDDNTDNAISKKVKCTVEMFQDPRVFYIRQMKHVNGAAARNTGIKQARGEFIAFLDDDDEWLPQKLELQIKFLEKNKEAGGVSCLYTMKKADKEYRKCMPYSGKNLQKKIFERKVSVYTSTVVLRSSFIKNASLLFDENLRRHQDLQFLICFLEFGNIEPVNQYLADIHTDSEINHPTVQEIIEIKKDFFNSTGEILGKYCDEDQSEIKKSHYFEVLFRALKERNLTITVRYILMIGPDFKAYRNVYQRYIKRKKGFN